MNEKNLSMLVSEISKKTGVPTNLITLKFRYDLPDQITRVDVVIDDFLCDSAAHYTEELMAYSPKKAMRSVVDLIAKRYKLFKKGK